MISKYSYISCNVVYMKTSGQIIVWDISHAQWFIHRSYRPNCFDSTHLSRGKMIPLWAETLVADILCWSKWWSHVCAAFLQVDMLYVMIYVSVALVEQFRFIFNYSFSAVKIYQCNYPRQKCITIWPRVYYIWMVLIGALTPRQKWTKLGRRHFQTHFFFD